MLPEAKLFCFDPGDNVVWTNAVARLACSTQRTIDRKKKIHDRVILFFCMLLICLSSDDIITTAMLLLRVGQFHSVSIESVIMGPVNIPISANPLAV